MALAAATLSRFGAQNGNTNQVSLTEEGIAAVPGVFRGLEIVPVISTQMQQMQELLLRLIALDQLLDSVPLQEQREYDLEAILLKDFKDPKSQEVAEQYTTLWRDVGGLYKVVGTLLRFDLIPATLVYVCKTSWQARIYENVYRRSDINKSRDPTCSEVLQLLPKLDRVLETSLSDNINAIVGLGRCS